MSEPIGTWRYRLSLSTTVKEGYRVGDVTVEFTESEPGTGTKEEREALSHEFQIRLLERIKDGARVAAQMNSDKAQANALKQ